MPWEIKSVDREAMPCHWPRLTENRAVHFEDGLLRIEDGCFFRSCMKSFSIPESVDIMRKFCFSSGANCESLTVGPESHLARIEEALFACCLMKSIVIPRSVEFLGKFCFSRSQIERVFFESESQLTRIQECCSSICSRTAVCTPEKVEFVDGSAFAGNPFEVIEGNTRFVSHDGFLIDAVDSIPAQHFGTPAVLGCDVNALGKMCFCVVELEMLSFASESPITSIGEMCFRNFVMQSIVVPKSVEHREELCFFSARIETLAFQAASQLRVIGKECFAECSLQQVCLPPNISVLPKLGFRSARIGALTFQPESQLRVIQPKGFWHCFVNSLFVRC
jgi:hypothetical protein